MGRADVYPFARVGSYRGERYPDWVRELKNQNGAYVIRNRHTDEIAYIGESHSGRLYGTMTRHFQQWSPKYDTAGPTYDRDQVEVAVVIVPRTHALYLQNDLICALDPPDNRIACGDIYEIEAGDDFEVTEPLPRGYDYDVSEIIAGLFYEETEDDDVPF